MYSYPGPLRSLYLQLLQPGDQTRLGVQRDSHRQRVDEGADHGFDTRSSAGRPETTAPNTTSSSLLYVPRTAPKLPAHRVQRQAIQRAIERQWLDADSERSRRTRAYSSSPPGRPGVPRPWPRPWGR